MWKRRVVYLLILVTTMGMYVALNNRQLLILLAILMILPIVSLLLLLLEAGKVHIDCELQDACVIYQQIGMSIKLVNNGHLGIGRCRMKIEYENHLFHQKDTQVIFLECGKREKLYYALPYVSEDCGRIAMKFSKVVCYDLMGLFTKKSDCISGRDFTVFPEVSEIRVQLKHLPESKAVGNHYNQSKRGNDVTEVFDMRAYQEGDSPKKIHWKLSSKLDTLVVREFSHPSNYHTLVLYDTSFDMKLIGANEGYHHVINGVFGMVASISKSLMNQNHVHHVGVMNQDEFLENEVEDDGSFLQMVTNMMSTIISTSEEDNLDEFMRHEYYGEYTKIVLVTGYFDQFRIQRLADYVDLTVILISDSEQDKVEHGNNYDVITLAVDSLTTKVQMLDI